MERSGEEVALCQALPSLERRASKKGHPPRSLLLCHCIDHEQHRQTARVSNAMGPCAAVEQQPRAG